MKTVRLLSKEQAEALRGQIAYGDMPFNPVQDANGAWVLSEEEATRNENEAFAWVSALPQIEYIAPALPPTDPLFNFTNPQ